MHKSVGKAVCIAFVVSTLLGQQQLSSQDDCGCQEYRVGAPAVRAIQRYPAGLPRNRNEDIAVVLYVPQNKYGCCPLTKNPSQPGIFPIKFELQTPAGFTARFRSGFQYKSYTSGTPVEITGGEKIVLLKVRARSDTPLGAYALHGKLTYQTIQNNKLQPRQDLDVIIPIKVIAEKEKPQEIVWPFGTHVKHTILTIIALPVEIPAAILLAIACSTPKGCDL